MKMKRKRNNNTHGNGKMSGLTNFYAFFDYEFKRFLSKRNLSIWLIAFLVILFFVNTGIDQFKTLPEKEKEFKKIQENYFKNLVNYNEYSIEGEKFLYIPSPVGILVRNTVMPPDMTSKVNSVAAVHINNNLKGKSLISNLFFGRLDFSAIILIAFSLLAMGYGYESLLAREHLKCLASIAPTSHVFRAIVLVRFLLIAVAFLVLYWLLLLFIIIRGVELTGADYTGFMGILQSAILMILCFFMIGVFFSTKRSLKGSVSGMLLIWVILIMGVPGLLVTLNEGKVPEVTRDYQTELEKIKDVNVFEKKSIEKYGKFDKNNMDIAKKVAEDYLNNDFKKIVAREERLKAELQVPIDRLNRLAILFPTTFYLHTCNEVSSLGYGGFMDFYGYTQQMFRDFVIFWVDRVFYHDPKQMVSFIRVKGIENTFRGRSLLPKYFIMGQVLQLVYAALLFMASYFRFSRVLFPLPENPSYFDDFDIKMEKGKILKLLSYRPEFNRQFQSVFYGRSKGLKWAVSLDGKDIVNGIKKVFLYVPHPSEIQGDIKVKHLLLLFRRILKPTKAEFAALTAGLDRELLEKRYSELEQAEKAGVLLTVTQLKKMPVYIFNDFIQGIPRGLRSDFSDAAEGLKENGALVIDLVSTDASWLVHDSMKTVDYKNKKYTFL